MGLSLCRVAVGDGSAYAPAGLAGRSSPLGVGQGDAAELVPIASWATADFGCVTAARASVLARTCAMGFA
jgi:hypothetical protein